MVHSACYTALPNVLILKCSVDRGERGWSGGSVPPVGMLMDGSWFTMQ